MEINDLGLGKVNLKTRNTRRNTISTVCKVSATVIFLISIVVSFFICSENYNYYNRIEINWEPLILMLISSFLLCLFLFAVGEIINQLSISNTNSAARNHEIEKQNEKIIKVLTKNGSSDNDPSSDDIFSDT